MYIFNFCSFRIKNINKCSANNFSLLLRAAFSFCFFNFLLRVCKSSSSLISDSEDEASSPSFAKTESARKPLSVFTPAGRTYLIAILFSRDAGLTRMGREVVKEMNRVGMVVDMSHSGEKSTLDAIEYSERPIAITHANPHNWHQALRNKSDTVMRELSNSGGMLGFSIYPHHF